MTKVLPLLALLVLVVQAASNFDLKVGDKKVTLVYNNYGNPGQCKQVIKTCFGDITMNLDGQMCTGFTGIVLTHLKPTQQCKIEYRGVDDLPHTKTMNVELFKIDLQPPTEDTVLVGVSLLKNALPTLTETIVDHITISAGKAGVPENNIVPFDTVRPGDKLMGPSGDVAFAFKMDVQPGPTVVAGEQTVVLYGTALSAITKADITAVGATIRDISAFSGSIHIHMFVEIGDISHPVRVTIKDYGVVEIPPMDAEGTIMVTGLSENPAVLALTSPSPVFLNSVLNAAKDITYDNEPINPEVNADQLAVFAPTSIVTDGVVTLDDWDLPPSPPNVNRVQGAITRDPRTSVVMLYGFKLDTITGGDVDVRDDQGLCGTVSFIEEIGTIARKAVIGLTRPPVGTVVVKTADSFLAPAVQYQDIGPAVTKTGACPTAGGCVVEITGLTANFAPLAVWQAAEFGDSERQWIPFTFSNGKTTATLGPGGGHAIVGIADIHDAMSYVGSVPFDGPTALSCPDNVCLPREPVSVTIIGTNLPLGCGAVDLGDAATCKASGPDQMVAIVDASKFTGNSLTMKVTMKTPNGNADVDLPLCGPLVFSHTATCSPNGGQGVTITGENFAPPMTVYIGDKPAVNATVTDAHTATFVCPPLDGSLHLPLVVDVAGRNSSSDEGHEINDCSLEVTGVKPARVNVLEQFTLQVAASNLPYHENVTIKLDVGEDTFTIEATTTDCCVEATIPPVISLKPFKDAGTFLPGSVMTVTVCDGHDENNCNEADQTIQLFEMAIDGTFPEACVPPCTVQIMGRGLTDKTLVEVGGKPCVGTPGLQQWSSLSVACVLPAGTGPSDIKVSTGPVSSTIPAGITLMPQLTRGSYLVSHDFTVNLTGNGVLGAKSYKLMTNGAGESECFDHKSYILCNVPRDITPREATLAVDDLETDTFLMTYPKPWVNPTHAAIPTLTEGMELKIEGNYLGEWPSLIKVVDLEGNQDVEVVDVEWDVLTIKPPSGVDKLRMTVTVAARHDHTLVEVPYKPPNITHAAGKFTDGAGKLTIDGVNFGPYPSLVEADVNGHPCTGLTISSTQDVIKCNLTGLEPGDHDLVLQVGEQYAGCNACVHVPAASKVPEILGGTAIVLGLVVLLCCGCSCVLVGTAGAGIWKASRTKPVRQLQQYVKASHITAAKHGDDVSFVKLD